MEFGAHIPQIGWNAAQPFTIGMLERYVTTARALGFTAISANDHIVYKGSWLDGPTMLSAALPFAEGLSLATTVGLPVVRGPAAYAKTNTAEKLADQLLEESAGWLWIGGRIPDQSGRASRGAGLIARYADRLRELFGEPGTEEGTRTTDRDPALATTTS